MRCLVPLAFLSLAFASVSNATWKAISHLPLPVTCGYFIDENVGLIGCGKGANTYTSTAAIWKTLNGGLTWLPCKIPFTEGNVSSIFMQDSATGYASVMYSRYPLWKTTDGGLSWNVTSTSEDGDATCVYVTSSSITKTSWRILGGSQAVGGNGFSKIFTGVTTNLSNGIDFLDDVNGVVTMGPDDDFGVESSRTYYTRDGGVHWTLGGPMKESWGVYADRQSGVFFSMAEGKETTPGHTLFSSRDSGKSWAQVFVTGIPTASTFTGHIAGVGSTLYIQTSDSSELGIFRSDDAGRTWNSVGGPSNHRDTRFVVTGCTGAAVFAFDTVGTVWKTEDGGDGTLSSQPQHVTIYLKSSDIQAHPGDTIDIPVYFNSTGPVDFADTTLLSLPFSLETEMLRVIGFLPVMIGFAALQPQLQNGVMTVPIRADSGFTISSEVMIGKLRCVAYLTDTLQSSVVLKDPIVGSYVPQCLTLSSDTSAVTIHLTGCGNGTLVEFMKSGSFGIERITPNPATNKINVYFANQARQLVSFELMDALGIVQKQGLLTDEQLSLGVSNLPSGIYYFRARAGSGSVLMRIIILPH